MRRAPHSRTVMDNGFRQADFCLFLDEYDRRARATSVGAVAAPVVAARRSRRQTRVPPHPPRLDRRQLRKYLLVPPPPARPKAVRRARAQNESRPRCEVIVYFL